MSIRGHLVLDGVGDCVTMPGTAASVKSVGFWVKPNDLEGAQRLIVLNAVPQLIRLAGATLLDVNWPPAVTKYVNGAVDNTLVVSVWQYVSVTTTGAGMTADAISVSSAALALYGEISDVMFFNANLSQSKFQEIYALGRNPQPSQVAALTTYSSLISWWPFVYGAEDGKGSNDGSFVGDAYVESQITFTVEDLDIENTYTAEVETETTNSVGLDINGDLTAGVQTVLGLTGSLE